MIGLLIGAAMLAPVAAQAQDQGRGDRTAGNGGGWQRGGGDNRGGGNPGGWQRGGGNNRGPENRGGGDRGGGWQRTYRGPAMDPASRAAVEQGRDAARAVERPAPVAPEARRPDVPNPGNRRDWSRGGDARVIVDNRGGDNRGWEGRQNRPDRVQPGRDDRRWDRDRDGRPDSNTRRWTTDRRDWDGRNWDRRNDTWSHSWRNDRRYRWQSYRDSHRSLYRLPRYQARYGQTYRRWDIGYRWDPWFYSSTFWINDPWEYRLPPAYGPYRWVRYYDDVVLVDTRSGEIVDIIYDFFF